MILATFITGASATSEPELVTGMIFASAITGASATNSPALSIDKGFASSITVESVTGAPHLFVGMIIVGHICQAGTEAHVEGYTYFDRTQSANATGKITNCEIWFSFPDTVTNCEIGTVYLVSGTTYQGRDSHVLGWVPNIGKQTYSGLDIDVVAGDFAAVYAATGMIYGSDRDGLGLMRSPSGNKLSTSASYSQVELYGWIALYFWGLQGTFATSIIGDTGTSSPGLSLDISFATAISAASATSDVDLSVEQPVQFASAITGVSTTGTPALAIDRAFATAIDSASAIGTPDLAVARTLASSITGASATSDVPLLNLVPFTSSITGASLTSDVELLSLCEFTSSITGATLLGVINLLVARQFASAMVGASILGSIDLLGALGIAQHGFSITQGQTPSRTLVSASSGRSMASKSTGVRTIVSK